MENINQLQFQRIKLNPWTPQSTCVPGERYIPGSTTEDAECLPNICTCNNGTAATGGDCTTHEQNICTQCDIGFKLLEDFTCIPKFPLECTADKMTNNVISRISYPFGTSSQLTFAQQIASSSPTDGNKHAINYASIGTVWTQEGMDALYNPRRNSQATLSAFIQLHHG